MASRQSTTSLVVEDTKGVSSMIQDLIMLGVVRLRGAKEDINLYAFNYFGPRFMAEILRGL